MNTFIKSIESEVAAFILKAEFPPDISIEYLSDLAAVFSKKKIKLNFEQTRLLIPQILELNFYQMRLLISQVFKMKFKQTRLLIFQIFEMKFDKMTAYFSNI